MRLRRFASLLGIVLVLAPFVAAAVFTVTTDADWEQGVLNGVVARNGSLELDTPLERLGFETELSLSYWDIWYGTAFVPETGFTGNDAIALNGSDEVPGVGNITQMNYSIPRGFTFESGSSFSAWMQYNASEDDRYRITYRLEGVSGRAEAWVDEELEEVVCATGAGTQAIVSDARPTWYNVNFTLYPADGTVYCEVRNDSGRVVDGVNLSTTVDFNRVVLRAEGDREPWAWFDDVTIPRYRAEGAYQSPSAGNDNIQDWTEFTVNAANITAATNVSAVFRAVDSSGTVVEAQVVTLANGTNTNLLTVPNSIDANVTINGSTADPAQTWAVASYTVRSNNTTIAAPSIDQAAVSPDTADPGETVTFTAELTDDDGDQNTVDLWHRPPGGNWTRLNRNTVTPVAADMLITVEHSFTSNASGTNAFLFNTTDANGLTSETAPRSFTITSPDTGDDSGGSGGGGGSDGEDSSSSGAGGGGGGAGGGTGGTTGKDAGTTNGTNATGGTGGDSDDGTTQPPAEDTDTGDDGEDSGNLLLVLIVLVVGLGVMAWYYLYR